MAEEEVGKIEINGTIYPVKDETARQNINTVATIAEGQYKTKQTKVTVGTSLARITSTTMTRIRTIDHTKGMVGIIKLHHYPVSGSSTLTVQIRVGGIVVQTFTYETTVKDDVSGMIYATEGTSVEIWASRTGSAQQQLDTSAEYLQLNSNA